jgi:predicted regulator of amino acid metabolism with ACT domain
MASKKDVQDAIANALRAIAKHNINVTQIGQKLVIKQGVDKIEIPINQPSAVNTDRRMR